MEEIKQLLKFLNASRSCYHAADQAAQILAANGYIRLWEEQPWQLASGGKYFALRGDASPDCVPPSPAGGRGIHAGSGS